MMTDPIADLLNRIRNALMARHKTTEVPYSKIREEIVRILKEEGYLLGYTLVEQQPVNLIRVILKYQHDSSPAITKLRRVYEGCSGIPSVLGGMGINIVSTSKGVMTGKAARDQGFGGEILCEIY